jgi:hypothetical protein
MNDINLKAILTPISVVIAGFLFAKLNFLGIDQATWNTLVFSGLSALAAGVLGFLTRTRNVIDTAGAQAGTTVITTKAMADSLPHNPDVVSSEDVKLVNTKTG